jgi:hypothetical protein
MAKSRIDALGLFLALVAGAFIFGFLQPFGWMAGIGGLVLLLVLFAYDHEGVRSFFQSLAFSSVCGFALVLIVLAFFESGAFGSPANVLIYTEYLPIAWVCATIMFTIIDRARMGGRYQEELGPRALGIPPVTARYGPPRAPAAQPVPEPTRQPEPEPVQAAPAESTSERTAMYEASAPAETSEVPVEPAAEPVGETTPVAERAVPVAHRKEVSIYLNLIGEGIAMMRTVRAEHMGKDFYLITEPMPETEQWEFTTGQIVRCKKKNLSHGKGLVAVEEAPRAQNRAT